MHVRNHLKIRVRGRVALAAVVTAAVTTAVALPAAGFAAPQSQTQSQTQTRSQTREITWGSRVLTVHLQKVEMRSPGFEVLVQRADGRLEPYDAPRSRSYLGSVDGDPAAVASGIIAPDGTFDGQVVLDRGRTLLVRNDRVAKVRGDAAPPAYHWPSSGSDGRNVTVRPGQIGSTTYRWDLGIDTTSAWFHSTKVGGSVERAISLIELSTTSLFDVYTTDALLRPALRRIVIRTDRAQDPYAGSTELATVKKQWDPVLPVGEIDDVALFTTGGGGVAYVAGAGGGLGVSLIGAGADGSDQVVMRHELGHTWGVHDNHTGSPEGSTINSGNTLHRFDGTELAAITTYRNVRQGSQHSFTEVPTTSVGLPPYAALDLVASATAGAAQTLSPLANDHDANLDALSLASVAPRSALGGSVRKDGDRVRYTPPSVTAPSTDSFTYVVRDATGRTATGVVLVKVAPTPVVEPVPEPVLPEAPPVTWTYSSSNSILRMMILAQLRFLGPQTPALLALLGTL